MDMAKKATEIYEQTLPTDQKIHLLEEFLVDCFNDMEAQEENMHPEVKHNNAEGYRLAKNYLRILEQERDAERD